MRMQEPEQEREQELEQELSQLEEQEQAPAPAPSQSQEHAQEHEQRHDEAVISDPELGPAPSSSSSSAASDGEVIDDPDLAASSTSAGHSSSSSDSPSPVLPSEIHFVLQSRGNRDLKLDDPREELWESTTLLMIDATLRRSESLRFGLGFVARYHFASLAHDVPDAKAPRYELDMVPSSGYVDASLAPGLHVRAGYQPVSLGRFDIFSASNVLPVADLRDGPATLPGRPEVGQLALMLDYDPVPWLSFRAIYIPFFMPNIVSVMDSDYALFPSKQANNDAVFTALTDIVTPDQLRAQLKSNLLRSARDDIARGVLAGFAPAPRPDHPQGALRATAHGLFGELSLTLATALEHMPTFRLSDETIALLSDPSASSNGEDPKPIAVEYSRFGVISADGSFDLAPFSLGFEVAYQFHRTQYAVGTAWEGDPYAIPVPGYTDIAQVGGRVEFADNPWLFGVEAFAAYALSTPSDPNRGWMFFESGRFLRGIAGMFVFSSDFGLVLQLGAAWLSGPSFVVAPRIGYDITSAFAIEVGAFIIEGQAPPAFATPILSLGGVWNSVDHVFAGIRLAL